MNNPVRQTNKHINQPFMPFSYLYFHFNSLNLILSYAETSYSPIPHPLSLCMVLLSLELITREKYLKRNVKLQFDSFDRQNQVYYTIYGLTRMN